MSETTQPESLRKRLVARAVDAFNRADELGGDLRDYLVERYRSSDRMHAIGQRFGSLLPTKKKVELRVKKATPAAAEEPSAPPQAASAMVHGDGLADPNLSAQIFGRNSCPWTGRVIRLLEDRKVDYDLVDLDELEDPALETKLVEETKQNTVPYVFLGGQFVGGYNATAEIDRMGQLQYAVMPPHLRATHPEASKIEIAPRPNTDETAPAESSEG